MVGCSVECRMLSSIPASHLLFTRNQTYPCSVYNANNNVYRQVSGVLQDSISPLSGDLILYPHNKKCSNLFTKIIGESCRRSCYPFWDNSAATLKIFSGLSFALYSCLKPKELVFFIFSGSPHSVFIYFWLFKAYVKPENLLNCVVLYFLKNN